SWSAVAACRSMRSMASWWSTCSPSRRSCCPPPWTDRDAAGCGSSQGPPARRDGNRKRRPMAAFLSSANRALPHAALLHAIGDATLGEVVRGHFDLDPVAGEDADVVLAHAAGDVGD